MDASINHLTRHTTPGKHRVIKYFLLTLLRIVARVDVQGLENIPSGAFVVVVNHLSSFDTLTGIAVGPRRQATTFAAIEHRADPIGGWILDQLGAIWVDGSELKRAFTYDWRLWTMPEIRELLAEAGFGASDVYWEGTDPRTGKGNDVYRRRDHADSDPAWIAYLVAVK